MSWFFRGVLSAVLLAGVSCVAEPPPTPPPAGTVALRPTPLPSPTGTGAGEPNWFSPGDGRAWLSWVEPRGPGAAVRLAVLSRDRWSEPTTVVAADDLFVNWADFPSVVQLADGTLAAHWLQRRAGPSPYAYDVAMAFSRDAGRSWSEPQTPHRDGVAAEHGFVSLLPESDGSVSAVWLDGRKFAGVSDPHSGAAEMTLRAARILPDGRVLESSLLDARTCDCCQTDAARVGDDLVVAYRDRSANEVRDIGVVRRVGGAWQAPQRLWEDGWQIPGCPVNGPAVDARADRVLIAWFSLVQGSPEVKVSLSVDRGASFAAPWLVARGAPGRAVLGRVDARWIGEDTAVVTWMEADGKQAEIRYRTVRTDGTLGPVALLGRTSPARASGFPRLVWDGARLLAAWRVPGPPARIEIAALVWTAREPATAGTF